MGRPKATIKKVTACIIENRDGRAVTTQTTQDQVAVTFELEISQEQSDADIQQKLVDTLLTFHPCASGSIDVYTASKGKKLVALKGIWQNIGKSKLYVVLTGYLSESAGVSITDDDSGFLTDLQYTKDTAFTKPAPVSHDSKPDLGVYMLKALCDQAAQALRNAQSQLTTASPLSEIAEMLTFAGDTKFDQATLDVIIDVASNAINVSTKFVCGIAQEDFFQASLVQWKGQLDKGDMQASMIYEAHDLTPLDFPDLNQAFEDIQTTGAVEIMDCGDDVFRWPPVDQTLPDLKALMPKNLDDCTAAGDSQNTIGSVHLPVNSEQDITWTDLGVDVWTCKTE